MTGFDNKFIKPLKTQQIPKEGIQTRLRFKMNYKARFLIKICVKYHDFVNTCLWNRMSSEGPWTKSGNLVSSSASDASLLKHHSI